MRPGAPQVPVQAMRQPMPPSAGRRATPPPAAAVAGAAAATRVAAAAPCALPRLQHSSSVGLVVMGESDHSRPLLIHRISKDNSYQRQGGALRRQRPLLAERSAAPAPRSDPHLPVAGYKTKWVCCIVLPTADDTIITWTDPEIGTDIALSFQARCCGLRSGNARCGCMQQLHYRARPPAVDVAVAAAAAACRGVHAARQPPPLRFLPFCRRRAAATTFGSRCSTCRRAAARGAATRAAPAAATACTARSGRAAR